MIEYREYIALINEIERERDGERWRDGGKYDEIQVQCIPGIRTKTSLPCHPESRGYP